MVTVNACTLALNLALLVGGIGPGNEVIVPSLTWCSTANAALSLGARPVFCAVDTKTLCLTTKTVRAKLTAKTEAVVVVHFGGYAVDVAGKSHVLPKRVNIIENAAHALGGAYPGGRPVGSSGNLVCFSFYSNKNLATAEGGAIALADAGTAEHLRSPRPTRLDEKTLSNTENICGI